MPKSADNFITMCDAGVPIDPGDFEFLTHGLTGVVKPQDAAALVVPGGTGTSSTTTGTGPADRSV